MKKFSNLFKNFNQPVFFITNDVAKGIGLENLLPNYHIVCIDDHPLVDYLINSGIRVFCLERNLKRKNLVFRSSGKIFDYSQVLKYIKKESQEKPPLILFFKPSAKIDLVCQKYNFKKIGNSSELNRQFEDKVFFYLRCLKEKIPVPPGEVVKLEESRFEYHSQSYGLPFVVQFGRGWAGGTTFFISQKKQLETLRSLFPQRRVKITKFIKGRTILNNGCIFRKNVFIGPPAVQIDSTKGLTSLPGATCGRQWPANISSKAKEKIFLISHKVGQLMLDLGYKGFFGLDFLLEEGTDEVFLSENNGRLTASAPFFTKMEAENKTLPLMAFHLLSFLKTKEYDQLAWKETEITGSEIVARNDYGHPVQPDLQLAPGIYKFSGSKWRFSKPSYFPDKIKKNEFWLTAAAKGRVVNQEQELVRLNFSRPILNRQGKIEEKILKLILEIKIGLKLKNVNL